MGSVMARLPFRYIHAYVDRHGHPRHYFRRKGQRKIVLPGAPGSPEFLRAYEDALAAAGKPLRMGRPRKASEGSVDALVTEFYASPKFLDLRKSSQRIYRGILERFRAEHGNKPVARMADRHIDDMIAERVKTPRAANNFRALMRTLMAFAVKRGYRTDNPVLSVEPLKVRSTGFHSWTENEIAAFERRWPIGTRARLAMALQLYTGQRRSDVVKMTWRDIEGGKIKVTQAKTGNELTIKIHPQLKIVLDATKKEHISILTTKHGSAMLAPSYGIWFRACAAKAGLPPECASHGLRKAAARRLAEAGCSAIEIAAVTGHVSLKEVERYTQAANREKMNESAIDRVATFFEKA